ncbi:hypothetical protein BV22DRAFT_1001749, partial [Leucogyrophana mollusca]
RYCSKKCQTADWRNHKRLCVVLDDQLLALQATMFNPAALMAPLPDGLTLAGLDERLEKWVKFHTPAMLEASVHALDLGAGFKRGATHLVRSHLTIRTDHGNSSAKFFRIKDVEVLSINDAMRLPPPWGASIDELRRMRESSEESGRGSVIMMAIDCPPLATQYVPFCSMRPCNTSGPYCADWRTVLIDLVESGRRPRSVPPVHKTDKCSCC